MFLDFYAAENPNKLIPLKENTYREYFNYNNDFSFRLPQTDVYNKCFENGSQENESEDFLKHNKDVENYHN